MSETSTVPHNCIFQFKKNYYIQVADYPPEYLLMDKQYDQYPAMGVRQMVDFLKGEGYHVGRKLVRRLIALMGMRAIYPLKSLSKGGCVKYRMPYLLRGMHITHRNQVWSTDISYGGWLHVLVRGNRCLQPLYRCKGPV